MTEYQLTVEGCGSTTLYGRDETEVKATAVRMAEQDGKTNYLARVVAPNTLQLIQVAEVPRHPLESETVDICTIHEYGLDQRLQQPIRCF